MKAFTAKEKEVIKQTYGSMKAYRSFLWEEYRRANHYSLDGNPFHKECMNKAEELYQRSFLKAVK